MWDCFGHQKPSSCHVLNVLMGCCCCSWFPLPCFANISLRKAEAVKHLYQVSDEISYQPCTPRSLFVDVLSMSFSTSILTPKSCTSGACFKPMTSYDCDYHQQEPWPGNTIDLWLHCFWIPVGLVYRVFLIFDAFLKNVSIYVFCAGELYFFIVFPIFNLFASLSSTSELCFQTGSNRRGLVCWCASSIRRVTITSKQ